MQRQDENELYPTSRLICSIESKIGDLFNFNDIKIRVFNENTLCIETPAENQKKLLTFHKLFLNNAKQSDFMATAFDQIVFNTITKTKQSCFLSLSLDLPSTLSSLIEKDTTESPSALKFSYQTFKSLKEQNPSSYHRCSASILYGMKDYDEIFNYCSGGSKVIYDQNSNTKKNELDLYNLKTDQTVQDMQMDLQQLIKINQCQISFLILSMYFFRASKMDILSDSTLSDLGICHFVFIGNTLIRKVTSIITDAPGMKQDILHNILKDIKDFSEYEIISFEIKNTVTEKCNISIAEYVELMKIIAESRKKKNISEASCNDELEILLKKFESLAEGISQLRGETKMISKAAFAKGSMTQDKILQFIKRIEFNANEIKKNIPFFKDDYEVDQSHLTVTFDHNARIKKAASVNYADVAYIAKSILKDTNAHLGTVFKHLKSELCENKPRIASSEINHGELNFKKILEKHKSALIKCISSEIENFGYDQSAIRQIPQDYDNNELGEIFNEINVTQREISVESVNNIQQMNNVIIGDQQTKNAIMNILKNNIIMNSNHKYF